MQHHLTRQVILNTESEFKNLYSWSLQEIDDEGKRIGRDQIPWPYSLSFTATELAFSEGIAIEPDHSSGDRAALVVRQPHHIRAKLRPGHPWEWKRGYDRQPSYSMFGTDRTISAFELFVEELGNESEMERCSVWGSVSYTFDLDFRDETTDDAVVFHLHVKPETFARYVAMVIASHVDEAVLSVSLAAGFYSDWSPSISTDKIKVLTGDQEHLVEVPEGCEINLPRLGEVGKVSFNLLSTRKLDLDTSETGAEDWLEDDEHTDNSSDVSKLDNKNLANTNLQAVALLASVRIAVWVIAALLALILIT